MGMCGALFWSILDQKELTNVPRPKEFTVTLTAGDRAKLTRVVSSGRHPARMITRAGVLLALDETAGPAPDRRVVADPTPAERSIRGGHGGRAGRLRPPLRPGLPSSL